MTSHPTQSNTATESPRYWHGGTPGLAVGDLLLPPEQTGIVRAAYPHSTGHSPRVVYVTTALDMARVSAADIGTPDARGDVYEVAPVGSLLRDPDFKIGRSISWMCRKAVIVAVAERDVRMPVTERVRALAPWLYWDDGTPQYDKDGYLVLTRKAADKGVTIADLRALGRWVPVDEADRLIRQSRP